MWINETWKGHSESLNVIRCCADRRGIYDILLALNSNLTSIFNRSRDITPSLYIHSPYPISVPAETGKRRLGVGEYALEFGVRVPRTLDYQYPTVKLNPR